VVKKAEVNESERKREEKKVGKVDVQQIKEKIKQQFDKAFQNGAHGEEVEKEGVKKQESKPAKKNAGNQHIKFDALPVKPAE
jgi:hypothetical protein